MLLSNRALSAYGYSEPCDMRKSFNTLSALVTNEMGHEIEKGDLFVFVSRDGKRAKVLHFDGTGLCLWKKLSGVTEFREAGYGVFACMQRGLNRQ